jgi:acetylornithine deacetylase/succinyl-diaminopimelate desuccinylase-like protein
MVAAALLAAGCTPLNNAVTHLASDDMGGRNNGSAGSQRAQDFIIDRLDNFAVGINSTQTGAAAFRQPFTGGTNIIGVLRGTDLADQYVIVGAHYDGLGSCRTAVPGDTICNGATDNVTGVAAVLEIGRKLAEGPRPRRSVVLALWDAEEDGLVGSKAYIANPGVPLNRTVAYVNFDIQGANLLPSLRGDTFSIGAETGGTRLASAVTSAAAPGALDTHPLSWIFGQGRSDYVNFIQAQVPTVFFSDSTGPCYHTAQDDTRAVDFTKLAGQTATALRLTQDLANGPAPAFVPNTPTVAFADVLELQAVGNLIQQDLARFTPTQQTQLLAFKADLDTLAAEGPAAFDGTDANRVLSGAVTTVNILTTGACDAFLAPAA